MDRFTRDFAFLMSVLILPLGLYLLLAGTQNDTSNSFVDLLGDATLATGGSLGIVASIRAHVQMREHERYTRRL